MKLSNIKENLDLFNQINSYGFIEAPLTVNGIRQILLDIRDNSDILDAPEWDYNDDTKEILLLALNSRETFGQILKKCVNENSIENIEEVKNVPDYFQEIEDAEDVKNFFKYLIIDCGLGMGFHPDNDWGDYQKADGSPLFTSEQVLMLSELMEKVFEIVEDPYEIGLELLNADEQNNSESIKLFADFTFYQFFNEGITEGVTQSFLEPTIVRSNNSWYTKYVIDVQTETLVRVVTYDTWLSLDLDEPIVNMLAGEFTIDFSTETPTVNYTNNEGDAEGRGYHDTVINMLIDISNADGLENTDLYRNDSVFDANESSTVNVPMVDVSKIIANTPEGVTVDRVSQLKYIKSFNTELVNASEDIFSVNFKNVDFKNRYEDFLNVNYLPYVSPYELHEMLGSNEKWLFPLTIDSMQVRAVLVDTDSNGENYQLEIYNPVYMGEATVNVETDGGGIFEEVESVEWNDSSLEEWGDISSVYDSEELIEAIDNLNEIIGKSLL